MSLQDAEGFERYSACQDPLSFLFELLQRVDEAYSKGITLEKMFSDSGIPVFYRVFLFKSEVYDVSDNRGELHCGILPTKFVLEFVHWSVF